MSKVTEKHVWDILEPCRIEGATDWRLRVVFLGFDGRGNLEYLPVDAVSSSLYKKACYQVSMLYGDLKMFLRMGDLLHINGDVYELKEYHWHFEECVLELYIA